MDARSLSSYAKGLAILIVALGACRPSHMPEANARPAPSASARACSPVSDSTARFDVHQIESLAGTYVLTIVEVTKPNGPPGGATKRPVRDSVRSGVFELWRTDSAHRYIGSHEFPLNGSTNIDLSGIASMTFTDPPLTSHDPDNPGVQVYSGGAMRLGSIVAHDRRRSKPNAIYVDRSGNRISVPDSIGNRFGDDVLEPMDGGPLLIIHEIAGDGFRGSWIDGAPVTPVPFGFFCAVRIPPRR